jgi:hypothetical protein
MLNGWRFAKQAELQAFLANFTGSVDGRYYYLERERALQHVLGGPLYVSHNSDKGESHTSSELILADMQPAGPEEVPTRLCPPRSSPGDADCPNGFYFRSGLIEEWTINGKIAATVDPNWGGGNATTRFRCGGPNGPPFLWLEKLLRRGLESSRSTSWSSGMSAI